MKPSTSWLPYQQFELISPPESNDTKPTPKSKLAQFWQTLKANLMYSMDLQVWYKRDKAGDKLWNGYDPVSQQSIHGVSEAEMRVWIEQRYH